MERQFFSGNTVEQAVLAAARHYGLEPERIAYKLRDKKHGFLNIRRRVVIEVDPAAPEIPWEEGSEVQAQGMYPGSSEREGRSEIREPSNARGPGARLTWQGRSLSDGEEGQRDSALNAFQSALKELTGLVDPGLQVSVQQGDEGFEIELTEWASVPSFDRKGRALDALEHLLPRMVRGLIGRSAPCRVDSQGFRAAREEELRHVAERAAVQVRSGRDGQVLAPMNPAERRLVHLALAADPTVRTESEGDGYLKRVRILPA